MSNPKNYQPSTIRNKYWKANVVQHTETESATDRNELLAEMTKNGRPFNYIGDINPAQPQPWPEEEKDWHALHEALVEHVKSSDALAPMEFDINKSRLPQLIFFGDSITEGWRGTSFNNIPGKHRLWKENEHKEVRELFTNTFGEESYWGKRALKPPLVLGISGSRTYDFLWRIQNGEFPTSKLLDHHDEGSSDEDEEKEEAEAEEGEEGEGTAEEEGDEEEHVNPSVEDDIVGDNDPSTIFQLDKLERIYIVLMGTNNLGGGMLPEPTVEGMDATGRAILTLHQTNFPKSPAAMLFSELLPRKDDFRAARMCPPRCKNVTSLEPYRSFMPAIERVNRALPEVVEGWRRDFVNSRIVLLTSQNVVATDEEESVRTTVVEKVDNEVEEENEEIDIDND
mmetsp:Transcript_34151/g.71895  ORF Transcript_34151/g.71895 Transcript_34151/m.71895 type:complete len:397 (-) Transcript_34151:326-1516(-)